MARSWWSPNLSARDELFLVLVVMLLPGCVLSGISFGNELPAVASMMAIEPGRTTCEQVLDLLGPPEEYAQPTPFFNRPRAWDPQMQRVLEERDLFRRRTVDGRVTVELGHGLRQPFGARDQRQQHRCANRERESVARSHWNLLQGECRRQ